MSRVNSKKTIETDELNVYESTIVLLPTLNEDENKEIFNNISNFITNKGGVIIESTFIGLKKLAYKIKKFENGYYLYFEFKIVPSVIDNLRILYNRDERIIRFLTCKLSKEGVIYNENRRSRKEEIITMLKLS